MTDLAVLHGRVRADARANAFAVVRNEMFYLRAFLDHHRRLGIEQFLFLDDRSSDGTRELLAAQPDCVVLESALRYGDETALGGRTLRAGVAWKTLVPRQFLPGRYVTCLDADEFLVLPAGVASVGELVATLERHDVTSVAATLIDFYPRTATEMDTPGEFATAASMLEAYGWFDALPLLAWSPGQPEPVEVGENATTRLFRRHGIRAVPHAMLGAPRWLNRRLPFKFPHTAVSKMPVVRWREGVEYRNSHRTNVPPARSVMVGLTHLKFTYDLSRRLDYALSSGAYARGSRKYLWYAELLQAMRGGDGQFLGPRSARYTGPADLARAHLTQFELD